MASMHPCNECSVQKEERGSENKRKDGVGQTRRGGGKTQRTEIRSLKDVEGFSYIQKMRCCWGVERDGGRDAPSSDSTTKCCTFPHNEEKKPSGGFSRFFVAIFSKVPRECGRSRE